MNSFYTTDELKTLGLKSFGTDVLISRKCSLYSPGTICLGNHVRIDDFCILSGSIEIGDYVHLSAFSALYGKFGIKIGNFCGISPHSTVYSASDDFSGDWMISPMVPQHLSHVTGGENYVQLGANTVVMPSVTCAEGSVTGAFSLVLKNLDPWTINFGLPCTFHKKRSRRVKELSKELL